MDNRDTMNERVDSALDHTIDYLESTPGGVHGLSEIERLDNGLRIFLAPSIELPPAYHEGLLNALGASGLGDIKISYKHVTLPPR